MHDYVNRAATYRERAEEMEALAETVNSLEVQKTFLLMASNYLEMAQILERLAGDGADGSGAQFKL